MASVQNIGLNNEEKKGENERNQAAMPNESPNTQNKNPPRDTYWFAHGGVENISSKNTQSTTNSPNASDMKDAQLQKDKEERLRVFREQQEEDRIKKLKDLEQQFLQAKKLREQQEEERKRRIEEARIKETERRQQVEERKRQIWEAEQERKEAILRRNMEREARIEARRNAQRNAQSFAFGSSTPRTFDLDLAAIGVGRNTSSGLVLMSSVSGRRTDERELGPPRATSACSLDRKFETFSHDDYSNDLRDLSRSMSLEPSPGRFSNISKQIALLHKSSNDMKACLTMWDNTLYSRPNIYDNFSPGWLMGSGVLVGEDCMSRSMVSLSSSAFRGRKRTDIMPTLTRERSITPHVTPRGKDTSRSPSRPQSSMSGASEISATSSSISAVNMRTRSAPRRPRPFSIAGSVVDRASSATLVKKEPESQRQPRLQEKNAQSSVSRPLRAKSVGREKTDDETPKPLSAPKKPVPPPKSKEVLARAKSHPVPTKDNLRKNVRPNITNTAKANIEKQHEDKEKLASNDKVNDQNKVKSSVESKSENVFDIVNSSPITSPVTDSEMCISSEDSKMITESDINTHSQTFTESDKADQSESVSVSREKNIECQIKESPEEKNIPEKSEEKIINVSEKNDQPIAQSQTSEIEPPVMTPQRPKITSEEEARAALAEKRRLAREQAEREAELERQRQEELRRQEEERQRIEEQKQREMEQEQIRLAEIHRQLEEEKLRKAIEEQKQREKEEQEKRQEEARLKAEKEEQERKAREEAEKQRLELEERLRKEEEERAERKRRVEQIMARTRGKSAQTPPATTPVDTTNKIIKIEDSNQSSNSSENAKTNAQESTKANYIANGSTINKLENNFNSGSIANNYVSSANSYQFADEKMSSSAPLPDLLNTNNIANCSVKSNGHHIENDEQFSSNISVTNSFNHTSNRTLSAMEIASPTQTNGYSSHEDMSCTTSPEETSDAGLLGNIESSQQNDAKTTIQPADFTKLVDIESSSLNMSNENFLINVDSVNSNILSPEKSYPGFDDCLQKKSDTTVADLLS